MWSLIYINFYHIIYLTSEGYFFDKRFKTLLSIAPVTFLFELLCLNLTYNQSVRVDFFVFTKELTRKGRC